MHGLKGEAHAGERFFHALPSGAARGQQRQRLAPERVNHMRSVDAPASGGLGAVENIGAVLEDQLVHGDSAVDGGIDGKGEDQANMVILARLF